ncbi:hypothetical protein, partial [Polaromonas jejuensis]|uniref:hypothetical protein n=1 Tax=Polaromonas jejuensis TaxID=457502 RepID=UPI001C3FEB46
TALGAWFRRLATFFFHQEGLSGTGALGLRMAPELHGLQREPNPTNKHKRHPNVPFRQARKNRPSVLDECLLALVLDGRQQHNY